MSISFTPSKYSRTSQSFVTSSVSCETTRTSNLEYMRCLAISEPITPAPTTTACFMQSSRATSVPTIACATVPPPSWSRRTSAHTSPPSWSAPEARPHTSATASGDSRIPRSDAQESISAGLDASRRFLISLFWYSSRCEYRSMTCEAVTELSPRPASHTAACPEITTVTVTKSMLVSVTHQNSVSRVSVTQTFFWGGEGWTPRRLQSQVQSSPGQSPSEVGAHTGNVNLT